MGNNLVPNGLSMGCRVFCTDDPTTVSHQIAKLKERFGLKRVMMVGDRGMITPARIEGDLKLAKVDWIAALRAPQIHKLAAEDSPL